MKNEDFNYIVNSTLETCRTTLSRKAGVYMFDGDRLHHIKQSAHLQKTTPESAVGGMLSQPLVNVFDMVKQSESGVSNPVEQWDKKIVEAINYLLLLKATVVEGIAAGVPSFPTASSFNRDFDPIAVTSKQDPSLSDEEMMIHTTIDPKSINKKDKP